MTNQGIRELFYEYTQDWDKAKDMLKALTLTDPTAQLVKKIYDQNLITQFGSQPNENYGVFLMIVLILRKQALQRKVNKLSVPPKTTVLQELFLLVLGKFDEWKEMLEAEEYPPQIKVLSLLSELEEIHEVLSEVLQKKGLVQDETELQVVSDDHPGVAERVGAVE